MIQNIILNASIGLGYVFMYRIPSLMRSKVKTIGDNNNRNGDIGISSDNDSDDITKTKQTNKETNRNNSTYIQMKTKTGDYTNI